MYIVFVRCQNCSPPIDRTHVAPGLAKYKIKNKMFNQWMEWNVFSSQQYTIFFYFLVLADSNPFGEVYFYFSFCQPSDFQHNYRANRCRSLLINEPNGNCFLFCLNSMSMKLKAGFIIGIS